MSGWRKRQIDQVMFDEGLVKLIVEEAVEAERARLQGQIETLHAMYQLASKQRDYLMDQQRAQIEALHGRIQ
jgi:hypothetical protein